VRPGHEHKVFDLDFGRVGVLIWVLPGKLWKQESEFYMIKHG
jgi:hypothetical protein